MRLATARFGRREEATPKETKPCGDSLFATCGTRPARTALGLVGLSISVVGVLGLYSLSGGLRTLVADTLGQIQGVMIVRENVPTPVFSDLPASLGERVRRIPGVRAVAAELWKIAPPVEGNGFIQNLSRSVGPQTGPVKSFWNVNLVMGEDIEAHRALKSPVGPKSILPRRARGWSVPRSDRPGKAARRHQQEDRRGLPRSAGPCQAGRRRAADRWPAIHHRRDLRDEVGDPGRDPDHGHRCRA